MMAPLELIWCEVTRLQTASQMFMNPIKLVETKYNQMMNIGEFQDLPMFPSLVMAKPATISM